MPHEPKDIIALRKSALGGKPDLHQSAANANFAPWKPEATLQRARSQKIVGRPEKSWGGAGEELAGAPQGHRNPVSALRGPNNGYGSVRHRPPTFNDFNMLNVQNPVLFADVHHRIFDRY